MTPHVPFSVIPTLAHLLVTLPRGYAHRSKLKFQFSYLIIHIFFGFLMIRLLV
jgi:hypothetical protein